MLLPWVFSRFLAPGARFGDRALTVAVPRFWNSRPVPIRESDSAVNFKRNFKTPTWRKLQVTRPKIEHCERSMQLRILKTECMPSFSNIEPWLPFLTYVQKASKQCLNMAENPSQFSLGNPWNEGVCNRN